MNEQLPGLSDFDQHKADGMILLWDISHVLLRARGFDPQGVEPHSLAFQPVTINQFPWKRFWSQSPE